MKHIKELGEAGSSALTVRVQGSALRKDGISASSFVVAVIVVSMKQNETPQFQSGCFRLKHVFPHAQAGCIDFNARMV